MAQEQRRTAAERSTAARHRRETREAGTAVERERREALFYAERREKGQQILVPENLLPLHQTWYRMWTGPICTGSVGWTVVSYGLRATGWARTLPADTKTRR